MSITITCACGKKLKVNNEFAGKQITCPACRHAVPVPEGGDDTGSASAIDADSPEHQGVKTRRKRAYQPVLVASLVLAAFAAGLGAGYFLFRGDDRSNKLDGGGAIAKQGAGKLSTRRAFQSFLVAHDEKTYAYSYRRGQSEMYVAEGLK